jgi:glycosyltransferase involved in cell wall biosynthesis
MNLSNWYPPSVNIVHKPHLLFLSYYFPPMGGGGVQRILKFLKFWDYNHFQISVLTVRSSYFYAEDHSLIQELPSQPVIHRSGSLDPFRLLFIIRKFLKRKPEEPSSVSQESGGFIRKLATTIFLPDSRILWLPFAVLKIWKIHRKKSIDLILASMPPFSTGLVARIAAKFFGIPYLLDFRDSWTANPYLPALSPLHQKVQNALEEKTINRSAGCIFVNSALQDYYLAKIAALKNIPSTVIRNGYDPDDFQLLRSELEVTSHKFFRMGIMGSVYSQGNAPLPLLKALTVLHQEEKQLAEKLQLVFIGKWVGEFSEIIKQHSYNSQILLVNYLPHQQALAYAKSLDAMALAVQSDIEGSEQVTPGRIYEYLYLRKPILAICSPAGDLAGLVRECQAGEVVDYQNEREIINVLKKWLSDPGAIISNCAFQNIEKFHRQQLTAEMIKFIQQFLKPGTSRTEG